MKERFLSVRKHSEIICAPLLKEDYVVQPTPEVSPPKWHIAHTTWFWEEFILSKYYPDYKRFHPRYAFLFNSYYDSIGERVLRLDRGNMSRPGVDEVFSYREYVDKHMSELFDQLPIQAMPLVEIGLNHEQQHQELLYTDIKYILGHNPLFPPYLKNFKETLSVEGNHTFIEIPEGIYTVGSQDNEFSFDNEHGYHQVYIKQFSICSGLVTNYDYLKFMNERGYEDSAHWHSDGWSWIKDNKINCPLYWHFIDGQWQRYSLSGIENVNLNEPVTHISFYEAAAYASWCGMRLPTEFEWECASDQFSWGQRWEHTNSAYLAYPGYAKPEGAVGEYNGKFMINQMVLRGASIATPLGHSRKTYRNFFNPELRWQFNGIRLCKKS